MSNTYRQNSTALPRSISLTNSTELSQTVLRSTSESTNSPFSPTFENPNLPSPLPAFGIAGFDSDQINTNLDRFLQTESFPSGKAFHATTSMTEFDFINNGPIEKAQINPPPLILCNRIIGQLSQNADRVSQSAKRRRKLNDNGQLHSLASQDTGINEQSSHYDPSTRLKSKPPYGSDAFTSPSPDALQQRLAASTNRSFLTGNLLRIYHDSMENALSCWLTEKTCPYGMKNTLLTHNADYRAQESMVQEWGPNWSNRICARVCNLDKVSSAIRGRPLTRSEDRAASRALHLAIMSFSTQWAQSSQRSDAEFSSFEIAEPQNGRTSDIFTRNLSQPASALISDLGSSTFPTTTDFDRSIQESSWHEARRVLQDAADIDSFRVIFAHIIFALTQKPQDTDHYVRIIKQRHQISPLLFEDTAGAMHNPLSSLDSINGSSRYSTSTMYGMGTSDLFEVDQLIELDGPPLFLETALRQILSYRCKLENIERQRMAAMKSRAVDGNWDHATSLPTRGDPLSVGDRKTFDLLFWLCIMFDTLSAAMNKRPLVVSDEDSDILCTKPLGNEQTGCTSSQACLFGGSNTSYGSTYPGQGDSSLWGDLLLRQEHLRHNQCVARWPCSYEDAASTLCDAAPVKVLLFRKVTHLQALLSRRVMFERLEETIKDALKVYDYWNDTYNRFMLDCVINHDSLPPRIQSWYIVLAGHWHLAGLLLADVIESIDEAGMGVETQRISRQSSLLVPKLRKQNASAISDLCRCSCPCFGSSFSKAREFHFAVSKGALLTEPWTIVLIRSFSKAGHALLHILSSREQSWYKRFYTAYGVDTAQVRVQCEYCIQGLWHLGKKSDIAFLAATALSAALHTQPDPSFKPVSYEHSMAGIWDVDTEAAQHYNLSDAEAADSLAFDLSTIPDFTDIF
ncbi:hypothetical protein AOQ84DRAFT_442163 [Glonium stellatum]|uniref:Transcription factor domain-containing protein n=1 Tax=Glonium stellatum TaxID=574774 RepID=A0A8E2ETJ6_9PEZI|nr:hypothetical protein AOQ84DRAFT_442163 [Glonium stellatum]